MALSLYKVGKGRRSAKAFRKKVNHNVLPDVSALTYEGVFGEYYFDILSNNKNEDQKSYTKEEQLVIPTYCFAKCKPPTPLKLARQLSTNTPSTNNNTNDEEFEYYMSVGLNENFNVNEMKRNNLNLTIVVDNSGSMSSKFDYTSSETKMVVANKAVIALLKYLHNGDRLSIISFNSDFTIIQPLKLVKNINMNELKTTIMKITAGGGTNMEMAYSAATSMYKQLFESMKKPTKDTNTGATTMDVEGASNDNELLTSIDETMDYIDKNDEQTFSNRIIFITDAQPNAGNSKDSLLSMVTKNGSTDQFKGFQIHTTFIGVGLDFNTKFLEDIIKVEGANCDAVHSSEDFMKTMDEEFKFMVTPLLFKFKLRLMTEGNSCCIDEAFGTGDDDKAIKENGELMDVKSWFPSQHDEKDQVKGGVVVVKLKNDVDGKKNASYNMQIIATYKDVNTKCYKLENTVMFDQQKICKPPEKKVKIDSDVKEEKLDVLNDEYFDNLGIRKSLLLIRYVQLFKLWMKYQQKQADKTTVTDEYKNIFKQFIEYFKNEMEIIGDTTLEKELKILNKMTENNLSVNSNVNSGVNSIYFGGRRGRRGKKKNEGVKKCPGVIRLQVDLNDLELPHNMKFQVPNKVDIQTFQVSITPDKGYWKGATYTFNFVIPDNYPYKPPKVTCVEKIYHPNIDLQGNVCLNLLKTGWNPIMAIQQIIYGLMLLFLEPFADDTFNKDVGNVFANHIKVFAENVKNSLDGNVVGGIQFSKAQLRKY